MYIFFIKWRTWKADIEKIIIVLNYFCKTLHCICFRGFWICQGFEYTRVMNHQCSEYTTILNIPRFWISFWFWICKGFDYTKVLNIPGFWTTRGLNMSRFWISFWFWICQGFEYIRVLYIGRLHRVLKMPEYAWIIPESA